jgi:hypothetical protein
LLQRRRHDAERAAQRGHVPSVVAEHPHGGRAVVVRQCALVVRQQPHQHRLAGAVRSEDRGVLPFADGEREPIEDGLAVFHDRGVAQFEQRQRGHAESSHSVARGASTSAAIV